MAVAAAAAGALNLFWRLRACPMPAPPLQGTNPPCLQLAPPGLEDAGAAWVASVWQPEVHAPVAAGFFGSAEVRHRAPQGRV